MLLVEAVRDGPFEAAACLLDVLSWCHAGLQLSGKGFL